MAKIRVLVVDDAVVVRRLVSDVLTSDPLIEVVGVAQNGKIALAKIEQLDPDLVTLDVEMPELDGLGALREIRKLRPRLPVIMFSTLTQRGTSATVEALTLGADDYVSKPANVGSVTMAMQQIRAELIPKIKALCPKAGVVAQVAPTRPLPSFSRSTSKSLLSATQPLPATGSAAVQIVAIGCSTGGPNALSAVLPRIPRDFPVPIVIVQHMPPLFTRLLAQRLDAHCEIEVREGALGTELVPGTAYIAPGDFHMRVAPGARPSLTLDQTPPRNSCRPAVDALFESVAAAYGAGVLGVVLTGMGQDGLRGGEQIRERGGDVIAQDEATSVVWGMPGFVARQGVATEVLPIELIADAIVRRVRQGQRPTPKARVTV
jgi:two-component system chemotaxis response regulator CheB